MRKRRLARILLVLVIAILIFGLSAGKLLVVDDPQPSDVIIVLAGETCLRPARAIELMKHGYGRRVLIDVPARVTIYKFPQVELAEKYIEVLPEAASIRVCPIAGLSTREETEDVAKCLEREEGSRILIVTSEFHTRRALSIFRNRIRGKSFSIAAARDDSQFGVRWWTHRQWAKTCLDEWLRLVWWNVVERWR